MCVPWENPFGNTEVFNGILVNGIYITGAV